MTKVKVELDCLKDLLKREPIVKIVEELPDKETADLNYIYIIPKEGEGKDKKAYVLRPDRSGFDTIDLTPQVVSVLGEGYISVEKETLNENGDVTFTVKTNETLANVLKELENKDKEQDGKLTNITDRITALEGKTDNFVSNVGVSRKGNTVKLTYTMVNGGSKEVEFTDKDTVYNDSELKEEVQDLGNSVASALHDISEIRVNNEQRLKALESKEDNDKQTLTIEGNTLSISKGNSVELPTATTAKPTKVTTDSEGVKVTHTETEDANNYNVNINGALANYYDKSKTYTKNEVDNLIVKQEEKATDITVYRGTFPNRDKVIEGTKDADISPRVTLTYSSSTGAGILKVDFKILQAVYQNDIIAQLPDNAPTPAELIEAQAWVGDVATSIWIGKNERVVRIIATNQPNIFNKRIIINIPGIFKK